MRSKIYVCGRSSGVQCVLVRVMCSQLADLCRNFWISAASTFFFHYSLERFFCLVTQPPIVLLLLRDDVYVCTIYRNMGKRRTGKNNEMINRDLLLPIPTDPTLKVDVSTNSHHTSFHCAVLLNDLHKTWMEDGSRIPEFSLTLTLRENVFFKERMDVDEEQSGVSGIWVRTSWCGS